VPRTPRCLGMSVDGVGRALRQDLTATQAVVHQRQKIRQTSAMDETLTPTSDPAEVEARLAMPLAEAMLTQRAVRRVLPDPIDDGVVLRCLELALEAPTASNGQNWEFVVVKDPVVKASLAAQYRRAWTVYGGLSRLAKPDEQTTKILKSVSWQVEHFEQIPVLVVCCLRGGVRVPLVPRPPISVSSHYGSLYPSVQNLLLAARSVGLGGALITLPLWSNTVARRVLELPLRVEPCCIVTLGWPTGRYGRKARKPIGAVVHLDRYGDQPWNEQART
jgi:nitroreductase